MSLRDVQENLYSREDEDREPKKKDFLESEFPGLEKNKPYETAVFKADQEDKSAIWIKQDEEKSAQRKKIKKIALISAGIILSLGLLVAGAMYIGRLAFSESKVSVTVAGPQQAKSGDPVELTFSFRNDNWVDLKDAVLYISYSDNFKPDSNLNLQPNGLNSSKFNVGTVKAGTVGTLTVSGKFFGTKDLLTYVTGKLNYSSSNFSSKFETEKQLGVMILSSPLDIEVVSAQSVYSGGAVTYQINYRNSGAQTFKDLRVKADYPTGFSFVTSEPLPVTDKNIWFVGDLAGGQSGTIKVIGSTTGAVSEVQRIKASIGVLQSGNQFSAYNETENSTKIVGSPLMIKQTINDSEGPITVNASDNLLFTITYRNTGTVPLRDVILTEDLKSPILNFARYTSGNVKGNVDSAKGKITWTGSQLDAFRVLPPGSEGQIIFSVPILDRINVKGLNDKNFGFSAVASMDSPDIPTPEGVNKQIASKAVDVRLNSKLLMNLKGFYNDADIQNSGPLPLKVGQETTFTMHLEVGNVSNDVTDARVLVTLSPGVKWKGVSSPKNESVNYNDRTGELQWNIGSLPAGIGVLTGPRTLAFQIGITPTQSQVGDFAPLLKKVDFAAGDVFTKQPLMMSLEEKNTNLTEDMSVGDGGKVQ